MRIVFDIETTGLLEDILDYSKFPLRPKEGEKIHCLVAKDIDTGKEYKFYGETLKQVPDFFKNVSEVIGHNILSYDLLVLEVFYGMKYEPDSIMGKPVKITDTLVWSRLLNPDRLGGHSLDAWGKKLGFYKGAYGKSGPSVWKEFSEDMLAYCVRDVQLSHKVYEAVLKEIGDWPWEDAYKTEAYAAYITERQSHFGFNFDKELAEDNLSFLNKELERIEKEVEPLLPKRSISKTAAKAYTPPKIQFKKSGEPSANLIKFVEKHGGCFVGDREVELFGKVYNLPLPTEPLVEEEPMLLSNQADIKEWLVSLGWKPTVWAEKDLTIDEKKQKVSRENFRQRVERYVEETLGSNFRKFRCDKLRCSPVELKMKLLSHDMKKPLKVLTSPKYVVNQDKDLCPSLIKLGDKVSFVKDIVTWLTYRHRRNSILGGSGKGFLTEIKENGRIRTPAVSCGAATSRYKHSIVCNIPRVTSMFGKEIRSLFGCSEGHYQIGYDFSGLEARVEGHFTRQFEGGEEYSKMLVAEKPNDIHTVMAKLNGITRDEQKSLKYALTYGAQVGKVSKMFGWSKAHAERVYDSFWENADPLKQLKDRVTMYWKRKGAGKFIKGIDGRKLWIRSEHSILNMLFQSTGVICAKKANEIHWKSLKKEGLLFDPFWDDNFEGKAFIQIHYHDEAQWEVCKSLVKIKVFDTEEERDEFLKTFDKPVSDNVEYEGKPAVFYSRVGELAKQAAHEASKYYNLRVDFDADYIVGHNWAECH